MLLLALVTFGAWLFSHHPSCHATRAVPSSPAPVPKLGHADHSGYGARRRTRHSDQGGEALEMAHKIDTVAGQNRHCDRRHTGHARDAQGDFAENEVLLLAASAELYSNIRWASHCEAARAGAELQPICKFSAQAATASTSWWAAKCRWAAGSQRDRRWRAGGVIEIADTTSRGGRRCDASRMESKFDAHGVAGT
jgi:hypothetical protein